MDDAPRKKRRYLTWSYAVRGTGEKCQVCGCVRSTIHKTLRRGSNGEIIRIRECEHCGARRLTSEETCMEYPEDY